MKVKNTIVTGMAVFCFMMMAAGAAWSVDIPGVSNGTVTDGGLVWLKNANCFGPQNWNAAKEFAQGLRSGKCGLTDGSTGGTWRLPTFTELKYRYAHQQGFDNIINYYYWSSDQSSSDSVSVVAMGSAPPGVSVPIGSYTMTSGLHVWPVRSIGSSKKSYK